MSYISIELLTQSHEEELYKFEVENRSFFESMVPSRGDKYYDLNIFREILGEIIEEQEKGLLYMYLVKDELNRIVGRVNLVSVVRGNFNKAELGYRIGKEHNGKGYGTKAVKLILKEALYTHKLHRIEAGTSSDNVGSQVVLIKNGFQFTGRYNKYILQNGEWKDSINFEKILD